MSTHINVKQLRASLPEVVRRVRKGERYTVIYRSRPAFQIVPVDETGEAKGAFEDDPLYRAAAVGRSRDGRSSAGHDEDLYPQ